MIAALFAVTMAAAAPTITPPRLPPVDQCRGDQGFDRFRASLEDAITRKDVTALKRLAAPGIRVNFGGDGSWDEFARQWDLNSNPGMSGLWKEMAGAIALGCAKTEAGGRVFPGLFEATGDDVDPFELLVARPGTKLHSRPEKESAVIATLDWTATIQIETQAPEGWTRVQLLGNGPLGWVETEGMLSPLGYRLVIEQIAGRWQISAFVAGD